MRTGNNIRLRKDGRYEARYEKERDAQGRIVYGYCYGHTYEEAENKRNKLTRLQMFPRELNLLVLGAGSHGEEVMELAQSLRVFHRIRFLDDFLQGQNDLVIGGCESFSQYLEEYPAAIPAVGNTALRIRWMNDLITAGFVIPTLIHPTAVISRHTEIGNGTVICARATVGTGAKIGRGCIISSGATVDRNVVLPDWSYVECGEIVSSHTVKRDII